jgi:Uma2 family endonuclease
MALQPTAGHTYADLLAFPEDNVRREIIDGELFVTPSPSARHQTAVAALTTALFLYRKAHGGAVFPAPMDVFFTDDNVVEPDVVFVRTDHMDRIEERLVRSPPDLVVEVSSPSTRRIDLSRKRELYERFGVPEYWFVDLDSDRVEIYRMEAGRYAPPILRVPGESLDSPGLPDFSVKVEEVLASPMA